MTQMMTMIRGDMDTAYHLVAASWFQTQFEEGGEFYLPEAFSVDGFVHLTHGVEHVLAAGNRYYRSDLRPYLALTVDLNAIQAEVRYEDADRQFPHIYGPIERTAIIGVQRVHRSQDGMFIGILP